jgi:hypothetical protein
VKCREKTTSWNKRRSETHGNQGNVSWWMEHKRKGLLEYILYISFFVLFLFKVFSLDPENNSADFNACISSEKLNFCGLMGLVH